MLVLTCRIGDTLRIGDESRVILQGRRHDRIAINVLAAAGTDVMFDNVPLQPMVLPTGTRSYQLSLSATRHFRVGMVEVLISLPGETVPEAMDCLDYIHVGLLGPVPLRIGYEQAGIRATPLPATGRLLAPSHLH